MSQDRNVGVVALMSDLLGTSEPALRLLLSVTAGYPLALAYRTFIYGKPPAVQHLFFILSGLALGYWNYGCDIVHTVVAVAVSYSALVALGATTIGVAFVFLFNMTYLLAGYYYVGTDNYDINWTMPQCVLVLRLIAAAFDLYDGQRPLDTLSAENRKVALTTRPTALEFFGHMFFPGSFMVGPQFPLKRYQDFVAGKFGEKPDQPPNSVRPAVLRFALGATYLGIFQILGMFVSDDYMLSQNFADLGFFRKMLLMGMWGRYTLYKYISCWLLTEGACTLFGVSYNGKDGSGTTLWNGLENVKLSTFENATEFNHYIQSFNINTNHWVAQYVYKRLKFLGNRYVSQLAALLFLAVWHGFHSGYYVCFLFEFLVVYMERDAKSIVKNNDVLSRFFSSPQVVLIWHLILRLYTFVFMGWCLMPFALLKFDRYWQAFSAVHHSGTLLFCLWPLVYAPLFRIIFKKTKKKEEQQQQQQEQYEELSKEKQRTD